MKVKCNKIMLQLILGSILVLSMVCFCRMNVKADHEDGIYCDFCGEYRYDDWVCDGGSHCSEEDSDCYEAHHCSSCGACVEEDDMFLYCGDHCSECGYEYCPDCGNCKECDPNAFCPDCDTCKDCFTDVICDDCGRCNECYENICDVCDRCNLCEPILKCGIHCENCVNGCPECGECTECYDGDICVECYRCDNCMDGFCENCRLCGECSEGYSCGEHCENCASKCPNCGNCQECYDGDFCSDCGKCDECMDGFCENCELCGECSTGLDCGEHCENCAKTCPECLKTCFECYDGDICVDCGRCDNCMDGYCDNCGSCGNCSNILECGNHCDNEDCNEGLYCHICLNTCTQCTTDPVCEECGRCFECYDGWCESCGLCGDCTNVYDCGEHCSKCTAACPECGECTGCSNLSFCEECGKCEDCVKDFCEECGKCAECVELRDCEIHCTDCITEECVECGRCYECYTDYICEGCGRCEDCTENVCESCGLCDECIEMVSCGIHCVECASHCELCMGCAECCEVDYLCSDCSICRDCSGVLFCEECYKCGNCVEVYECELHCEECISALKITKQPTDESAISGEKVSFKVTAIGDCLTYQWQYRNAGATSWSNSKISSAKKDTLTFTVGTDATLNNREYRCVVTDCSGSFVISNTVKLRNDGLLITAQPESITAKVGDKVTFKVEAIGTGITYQWQYKNAGATNWSNSGVSSAKTASFSFTVGTDDNLCNRQYRCVVSSSNGENMISDPVMLTVDKLKITEQPKSATVFAGEKVSFTVKAIGIGLTYQWQYKNANATTWSNSGVSTAKTATFSFTANSDANLNGRQYRCVVKNSHGEKLYTEVATLKVNTVAITSQPKSVLAAVGQKVTFSVGATGTDLTYQWQYKNAGATTWSNSGVSTAKTATFSFTVNSDAKLNGRQYRCVVKSSNGETVISGVATLNVTSLAITSQPKSVSAKVGSKVTFTVGAVGTGLTYQWQYKNAKATTWSNSGITAAKTASFNFTVNSDANLNGRQYRCVVKNAAGDVVYSNVVTLTVTK